MVGAALLTQLGDHLQVVYGAALALAIVVVFTPAATMRGFDEDDFREVGEIIAGALGEGADIDALRSRSEALCDKRPLYPGFRGYTTYVT